MSIDKEYLGEIKIDLKLWNAFGEIELENNLVVSGGGWYGRNLPI